MNNCSMMTNEINYTVTAENLPGRNLAQWVA